MNTPTKLCGIQRTTTWPHTRRRGRAGRMRCAGRASRRRGFRHWTPPPGAPCPRRRPEQVPRPCRRALRLRCPRPRLRTHPCRRASRTPARRAPRCLRRPRGGDPDPPTAPRPQHRASAPPRLTSQPRPTAPPAARPQRRPPPLAPPAPAAGSGRGSARCRRRGALATDRRRGQSAGRPPPPLGHLPPSPSRRRSWRCGPSLRLPPVHPRARWSARSGDSRPRRTTRSARCSPSSSSRCSPLQTCEGWR